MQGLGFTIYSLGFTIKGLADAVSSISFASMVIVGSMYCRYRRCCKECGVLGFTVYLGFRIAGVARSVGVSWP